MNEMKQTIRELPESSRPYEKCLQWGPSVLSDSELLAVILRSGVQGCNSLVLANQILSLTKDTSYPGLLGLLHMSIPDLMKVNGIGKVKAVQLKCIGELSKRMASAVARPRLSFNEPITIAKYYMERLRHEERAGNIDRYAAGWKKPFSWRADAFPGNREFNSDHSKGGFYGSIEVSRCKCDPGS